MLKKEPKHNIIQADILSFKNGTEHFEGLHAIRIISRTYNLLIMDDYISMIGEVDGTLSLVSPDGTIREYENVKGFYKHSHNTFEFILKEQN